MLKDDVIGFIKNREVTGSVAMKCVKNSKKWNIYDAVTMKPHKV